MSFTGGGEQAPSNEGLGDLGSTVNRFSPETNQGFSLVDHQEENSQKVDPYSQQYEQSGPGSSQNLEQEFMKLDESQEHQQHLNTGIGNIAEESVKIVNLDTAVANKAGNKNVFVCRAFFFSLSFFFYFLFLIFLGLWFQNLCLLNYCLFFAYLRLMLVKLKKKLMLVKLKKKHFLIEYQYFYISKFLVYLK